MEHKPRAIALMGPTASGKTDLAIALHEQLGAEIISVDSALIYRGMDIGTAKPTQEELRRAPHRLIDILDPSESYSAADFVRDARREMAEIIVRGAVPLLVGGTMMYFKALVEGLSPIPASDPEIRQEIEKEAAELGWPNMHAELKKVDPRAAERLHPNHSQRIGRALEVFRGTGRCLSDWQNEPPLGSASEYDWVQIAIAPQQRAVLHDRIARRFELMLEHGFIDEVQGLRARGDLHLDLPSMRCVGYRQVWQYLDGDLDLPSMRAAGIAATRQLAKRQHTWLRGWNGLNWVNTLDDHGKPLSFNEIFNQTLNILGKRAI